MRRSASRRARRCPRARRPARRRRCPGLPQWSSTSTVSVAGARQLQRDRQLAGRESTCRSGRPRAPILRTLARKVSRLRHVVRHDVQDAAVADDAEARPLVDPVVEARGAFSGRIEAMIPRMPLPGCRASSATISRLGVVVVVVDRRLHEDRARRRRRPRVSALVVLDREGLSRQRRQPGGPAVASAVGVDQVLVGVEQRQHRGLFRVVDADLPLLRRGPRSRARSRRRP